MTHLFTRPVDALVLHEQGEIQTRIGSEKRTTPYEKMKHIENLLIENSLLPISADVGPIHPPFFTEYSYCDVFGGFLVTTMSSEINYRHTLSFASPGHRELTTAVIRKIDTDIYDFIKSNMKDKYQQGFLSNDEAFPEKVIFMTGSNLFMRVVDTNKLDEMMASDDWCIKPHPLTNPHHLKEYGFKYGYDRIINKDISGHLIYQNAKKVGTVNTSEFALAALIDGKPCTDLTAFSERHGHGYSSFIETGRTTGCSILEILATQGSGFVCSTMSDEKIIENLHFYQRKTISLRENFRMQTHQKLQVVRKPGPTAPERSVEKKGN